MIIYLILYVVPAYFIFAKNKEGSKISNGVWWAYSIFLVLIIGLRKRIGCDWDNYKEIYESYENQSIQELSVFSLFGEIGFEVVNIISNKLSISIYGVNTICAIIFVGGLIKFCKSERNPWLAILISTPYLIIVVSMGYTRQSVAVGALMYAIVLIKERKLIGPIFAILIGALFHKSVFLLQILNLGTRKFGIIIKIISIIVFIALVPAISYMEELSRLSVNYLGNEDLKSDGGFVRIILNVIASGIFFIYLKRWKVAYGDQWVWGAMATLSLISLPLVISYSTAVDRMAIYLIPLQVIVFSRLPELILFPRGRKIIILGIVTYYGLIQLVWLIWANYSLCWVPYDNLLIPKIL